MGIDFALTEDQQAVRALARDFARAEVRPRAALADEREELRPLPGRGGGRRATPFRSWGYGTCASTLWGGTCGTPRSCRSTRGPEQIQRVVIAANLMGADSI
jgi:hypothetical protein